MRVFVGGRGMLVSLLAMFVSCVGVLLRLFVFAEIMMMGGLGIIRRVGMHPMNDGSRPIADIRRERLNVGDRGKAAIADRDAGRHSWGKVLKSLGNVAELRGIHSSGLRLALAPSAR